MEFHFGDQILKRYKGRFDATSILSDIIVINTSTGENIQISDSTETGRLSPGIYRIDVSYQEGYAKKVLTVNGQQFKSGDTFKLNFGDNLTIISEGMEKRTLDFTFSGNIITGYTGTDPDITIPMSYSKADEEVIEQEYFDWYSLYRASTDDQIPVPYIIDDSITITSGWGIYSYQDQIEALIEQNGKITVRYETYTPIIGNDYTVTAIKASAFANNSIIESVRFNHNIKINDNAFQNCINLKSTYFEEDIEFTSDAFSGCISLFVDHNGAKYIYNAKDNLPYFLQSIINVTTSDLSILEGTKFIGSDYSAVNNYIESIYFPSSVKAFTDTYPYYNWTALKTLDLSDTQIKKLLSAVIYKATNLTNLYVPATIEECSISAYDFTSLQYITYDNGKYIGERDGTPRVLVGLKSTTAANLTFAPTCKCTCTLIKGLSSNTKNTYLKTITLNEGLYAIGSGTFNYFTALSTINWCSTIKKVNGFYHCLGLRNINLPEGLETIDSMAFGYYASTNSRTIHIPSTVQSIGDTAFAWSYTSANTAPTITVTVSEDNPVYSDGNGGNVIYKKDTDTLIFIPDGGRMPDTTKIIAKGASSGHGLKQHIYMAESIEEIKDDAFGSTGCEMPGDTSIPLILPNIKILGPFPAPKVCVFGPNLTKIYNNSIWSDIIEEMYFESIVPPVLESAVGTYKIGNAKIYVPYGSLEAYQTASNWSGWADRMYEGIYQGE